MHSFHIHFQLARTLETDWSMCRSDNHSTTAEVIVHQSRKPLLRWGIK
jgi:hypothetical protein